MRGRAQVHNAAQQSRRKPAITGSAFDPTGPPVTVETVNASGSLVSSSVPVTIALGNNPGGAMHGGTTTEDAVNGVATFSELTLNNPGHGYTLLASSPGLTGAASNPFDETSAGTVCQHGRPCSISLSTSTSTLDVTASPSTNGSNDAGTLTGTADLGQPLEEAAFPRGSPPSGRARSVDAGRRGARGHRPRRGA